MVNSLLNTKVLTYLIIFVVVLGIILYVIMSCNCPMNKKETFQVSQEEGKEQVAKALIEQAWYKGGVGKEVATKAGAMGMIQHSKGVMLQNAYCGLKKMHEKATFCQCPGLDVGLMKSKVDVLKGKLIQKNPKWNEQEACQLHYTFGNEKNKI